VRLYGCMPKSASAGLGCGLGCTPALSVSHVAAAVCGLQRYISAMPLPLPFNTRIYCEMKPGVVHHGVQTSAKMPPV